MSKLQGPHGPAPHDVHPASEIFPLLEGEAFEQLCADIAEHGLRTPIVLTPGSGEDDDEDLVLDGRNRYRACLQLGIRPHFEHYRGDDAVAFVISTNLRRRHLDESQRAMVAAKVAGLGHGGDRVSEQGAKMRLAVPTQDQAAAMLNVGKRSVQHARVVQDHGTPELAQAVEQGKVAVSTAATLVELPPEQQRRVPQMTRQEILAAAKEINRQARDERRTERVQRIAKIESQNRPIDGSLGQHSVHYWDPPWEYEEGTTDDTRQIANKYPPMKLADICALPVQSLCTPDAVMYMWTTAPKVEEAFEVMRAWGFTYRSQIIWHKTTNAAAELLAMADVVRKAIEEITGKPAVTPNDLSGLLVQLKALADGMSGKELGKMGMGYWARIEHEILLIGTRGKFPTPPSSLLPRSVIAAPLGDHSAKPHLFAEMLERLYPELSKFEGFCRSPRAGWTVFGNQSAEKLPV